MTSFAIELKNRLDKSQHDGVFRNLVNTHKIKVSYIYINNKKLLNLASNDYLNLSNHPKIIAAAKSSLDEHGCGATSSRLIVGNNILYEETEKKLANLKQTESALLYPSGYHANIGSISALMGRKDIVFSDKLSHASILDGIMLTRSIHKRFRHNDMDHLKWLLNRYRNNHPRALIITESIFSMDGDIAPIEHLVELKKEYDCWLMLDEAHATGVLGEKGGGLAVDRDLADEIEIHMGTTSKAFGSIGGYIAGKKLLIDYLVNSARSFIYSTALPAPVIASINKGIDLVIEADNQRKVLQKNADYLRSHLSRKGINTGVSQTHIVPLIVGENKQTVEWSKLLLEAGIALVAIRPPTVPQGEARLRISLTSAISKLQLEQAVESIIETGRKAGVLI